MVTRTDVFENSSQSCDDVIIIKESFFQFFFT